MNGKISAVYFSPTHTTQKIIRTVKESLAQKTGKESLEVDLTLPDGRGKEYTFNMDDILILGFPVYGGRVPKFLGAELVKLKGTNTKAVILATYGNRDYDDAIIEAKDILISNGFCVIAAGAFIGEHSHSFKLAADRPDENDLAIAKQFGEKIAEKLTEVYFSEISIKGKTPYKAHMADMPFLPKTKDNCTDCKLCARVCPMGIISEENPTYVKPVCITCHACVKSCPVQAKYFDAEPMHKVVAMLEGNFMERKEPELMF